MNLHRIPSTFGSILAASLACGCAAPYVGAVDGLTPGEPLRVTSEGQRHEGRFVPDTTRESSATPCLWSSSSCSLLLRQRDSVVAVPPLAVDSLWVEGHSAARGAGIGAALLGATFAVLMAVDCRSRAEQNPTWWFACDTGDELAVVLALSGVIGGATGAVLGGLVGWAVPRWQLRFVRPR